MEIHTLSLPGIIWNVVLDHYSERMIIEWRSPEERKVNYASLDLKDISLYFEALQDYDPGWWTGLSGATGNVLFLHDTPDPKFPEQKGIMAFDSASGRILWKNQTMKFSFAGSNIIEVYQNEEIQVIDPVTGEVTGKKDFNQKDPPTESPLRFNPEDEEYSKLTQLLINLTGQKPTGNIEYLESNNVVAISYFTGDKKFTNKLLILSEEGEILFQEILGENQGEAFQTFFVYDNLLFTVKNKTEMLIFEL